MPTHAKTHVYIFVFTYMYIFMHSMYCIYLGVHLGKNTSGWIVQCCLCILSEPCAATMFDQPTLPPPHHGSVKSGRKSSQIARCLSRSFHFFHWTMIVFEKLGNFSESSFFARGEIYHLPTGTDLNDLFSPSFSFKKKQQSKEQRKKKYLLQVKTKKLKGPQR